MVMRINCSVDGRFGINKEMVDATLYIWMAIANKNKLTFGQ